VEQLEQEVVRRDLDERDPRRMPERGVGRLHDAPELVVAEGAARNGRITRNAASS
jgi:hypothetical protein